MIARLNCPCGRPLGKAARGHADSHIAVTAHGGAERREYLHREASPPYITYTLVCSKTMDQRSRQTWRTATTRKTSRYERRSKACGDNHQFTEPRLTEVCEQRWREQPDVVLILGVDL